MAARRPVTRTRIGIWIACTLLLSMSPSSACDCRADRSPSSTESTASSPPNAEKAENERDDTGESATRSETSSGTEEASTPDEEASSTEELPRGEVLGELEQEEPLGGSEVETRRVRRLYDARAFEFTDRSDDPTSELVLLRTWSDPSKESPDALVAVDPTSGESTGPFSLDRGDEAGLRWGRDGDWLVQGKVGPPKNLEFARLTDGKQFEPDVRAEEVSDGSSLKLVDGWFLEGDDGPEFWITAVDDSQLFVGRWTPPSETIELRRFRDGRQRVRFVARVGDRYVLRDLPPPPKPDGRLPTPDGCAYMTWVPGENPTCRRRAQLRPSSVTHLGDGWALHESRPPTVLGPDGRSNEIEPLDCASPLPLVLRHGNPGFLSGCRVGDEQRYVHWTPERTVTFGLPSRESGERRSFRSITRVEATERRPVVTGWWRNDETALVDYWYDMEHRRFWRSEKLFPLHFGGQNDPVHALAADAETGETLDLFLLDFREGVRRRIATYDDCPGKLREADHSGRHAVVYCVVRPNPSKFRFRMVWAELVDLTTGDRARLDRYPHQLLDDGRLVVSDRPFRRPGAYLRGSELQLVELAD